MPEQTSRAVNATDFNTISHVKRNMALAAVTDTARGMFFNGAVQVVRQKAGDVVAERCRAITGERKHIDFFNYPVSTFLQLCLTTVDEVGAQLGGCEATLRWIGEQSARDFLASMAGRTMVLLAGGNLKRVLTQLPSGYGAAVSYGERRLLVTEQKQGRFVIKHDFLPHAYHEGILRGVMLEMKASGFHIQGRSTGPLDSEYDISWK